MCISVMCISVRSCIYVCLCIRIHACVYESVCVYLLLSACICTCTAHIIYLPMKSVCLYICICMYLRDMRAFSVYLRIMYVLYAVIYARASMHLSILQYDFSVNLVEYERNKIFVGAKMLLITFAL